MCWNGQDRGKIYFKVLLTTDRQWEWSFGLVLPFKLVHVSLIIFMLDFWRFFNVCETYDRLELLVDWHLQCNHYSKDYLF